MPTALITGVAGQDGSYLAEFLAARGYRVVGTVRPGRAQDAGYDWLRQFAQIVPGDLAHPSSIRALAGQVAPDEIYNLGGITTLAESSDHPERNHAVNAAAALSLIEAVCANRERGVKFCQASSSQIFGPPDGRTRDESTPLAPHNEYARAKALVDEHIRRRRADGWFLCSAILFNHESPRRRVDFVSRKISSGVAMIAAGKQRYLELGSLTAARDWSFAGDVIEAMWLMLQEDRPRDYVVASGVCRTVEEMVREAFAAVGITDWDRYVVAGPARDDDLCSAGDASLARRELGWAPRMSFSEMVRMMVDHDVQALAR